MKRNSSGPLFCLLILILLSGGCELFRGKITPKNVIVTVNGLEFLKTVPGELSEFAGIDLDFGSNREDYLNPRLSAALGEAFEVRTFDWSGDATETGTILRATDDPASLRGMLRAAYGDAKDSGGTLIVVAHSWGTVLSYLALALESSGDDPIICDLFITLSSPLGAGNAGSTVNIPDMAVSAYSEAWLEDLGFDIGGALYPRARSFINYWAWGDAVSGPLSNLVPAEAGVRDVRVDVDVFLPNDGVLSTLKRGIDDTEFWHTFTALKESVVHETGYAAGENFADLGLLVRTFREQVFGEIRRAALPAEPQLADRRLRLSLSSITCIAEPEWGNSEFYGFFDISVDEKKLYAKNWYENGDLYSAWIDEDETRAVGWDREILAIAGVPMTIKLSTSFYEDDIGGDGPPGAGSAIFSFDGSQWLLSAPSGSYDCAWTDGDGEGNSIRVNWAATLLDNN